MLKIKEFIRTTFFMGIFFYLIWSAFYLVICFTKLEVFNPFEEVLGRLTLGITGLLTIAFSVALLFTEEDDVKD